MVFDVSPAAKLNAPVASAKSTPSVALTPSVVKSTVTALALAGLKLTVNVIVLSASFTLTSLILNDGAPSSSITLVVT